MKKIKANAAKIQVSNFCCYVSVLEMMLLGWCVTAVSGLGLVKLPLRPSTGMQ